MIKNKIQSKVAKVFNSKLADAVDSFTCSKQIQSGDFDFAMQTYPVITVEEYSGRGVLFGSYLKDMMKPIDYQVTDCKATVLQNEVGAVPDPIDPLMKDAACEIIKGIIAKVIYAGIARQTTSESVKADTVQVTESFADGSVEISEYEQIAKAYIDSLDLKPKGLTFRVYRA